jgi:hypothetical protein
MAEQRLIDANALLKSYDVAWMVEYDETGCGVRKKAIPTKTIEDAPTIDAVKVVRCGECDHARELQDTTYVACIAWCRAFPCNGFCHMGKKKVAQDMDVPTKDGGAESV